MMVDFLLIQNFYQWHKYLVNGEKYVGLIKMRQFGFILGWVNQLRLRNYNHQIIVDIIGTTQL